MNQNSLECVWKTELEILDEIHRICLENNLKYSLAYGTLLGAVRHQGFIPWDDDIDIMMPREDYNKLLSIWNTAAKKEFIIQNKGVEPNFTQNFTKIRKNNTAYVQDDYELKRPYHTGIFVDIFPADRVAPAGLQRKMQIAACMFNLLYSREHSSGEKTAVFEKILLSVPRRFRLYICRKTDKYIQKWDSKSERPWFLPSTKADIYHLYDSNIFDNLQMLSFEDRKYYCVCFFDEVLREEYGDYMKLPPEEERVMKHHPVKVLFEKNY